MIKKQVIFNVGGALSSYLEFDGKKVIIDLGKSQDFNPVIDFLLPLAKRKFETDPTNPDKYTLDQIFLSHLDDDHISSIEDFDQYFNPRFLTVPCEHPKQNFIFNIIREFIIKPKSENLYTKKVLSMMNSRWPGYGRRNPNNSDEPLQEDQDRPLIVLSQLCR